MLQTILQLLASCAMMLKGRYGGWPSRRLFLGSLLATEIFEPYISCTTCTRVLPPMGLLVETYSSVLDTGLLTSLVVDEF